MADLPLHPRPALGARRTALPRDVSPSAAGVTIGVRADIRQAVLVARRGQAATLAERCGGFGVALPLVPGRLESRGVGAVWTGPGQWLIDWEPRETGRAERLFAAFASLCSVVAAEDARVRLTVAGPRARDTLAKMLTIDLHPRAFKPGDAAVTAAGGIAVILWLRDDEPSFECAVPRSLAGSFWDWLVESAAEFGVAAAF